MNTSLHFMFSGSMHDFTTEAEFEQSIQEELESVVEDTSHTMRGSTIFTDGIGKQFSADVTVDIETEEENAQLVLDEIRSEFSRWDITVEKFTLDW